MKNIMILGTCRSGKTTFSKLLQKRLNNYQIIEVDAIISALQSTFNGIQIGFAHDCLEDNKLSEFINILLKKNQTRLGDEYSYIINSDSIMPEDLINYFDLSNTIVYYFVSPKLTIEEIFNNCRYYDDKNQWTSKRTNENLLNHIKKAKEFENTIIEQCTKYNIKYIDTSYNREKIFNDLLVEIEGNI